MAVRLNDAFLVNRLLELKANIRKRNKEGETVIYTAIRNQTNKDIIKKLFQHVDINEKIDNYGSYLNLAVTAKQNENFYYLIQEFGIKYQIKDDEDNTCLLLAVR
jgi:ankyrin repeat protein